MLRNKFRRIILTFLKPSPSIVMVAASREAMLVPSRQFMLAHIREFMLGLSREFMLVHIKQGVTSVIHQLVSQQVASLSQQQGGLGFSDSKDVAREVSGDVYKVSERDLNQQSKLKYLKGWSFI